MQAELKTQTLINKRVKEINKQKAQDIGTSVGLYLIDKLSKYISAHNDKIQVVTDALKRVRVEQETLDQRFASTHKSVEYTREAVLEDIKVIFIV